MTMKTTIISSGANPPPDAGAAPCAKATGIRPFMTALPVQRGRHYATAFAPIRRKSGKRAGSDGCAQRTHQLQVKMQVMKGVEPGAQDFVAAVEMAEVGARVIPAGVATARRIDGA